MRQVALKFLNREAMLVLKGQQRIRCWVTSVQEDRIITRPVNLISRAGGSSDLAAREIYRYVQLADILEVDAA